MFTAEPTTPDGMETVPPMTLAELRALVLIDWNRLPGSTLVVLSRDAEGNAFSPVGAYASGRYHATYGLTGEIYPLESELAHNPELRRLCGPAPDGAVAALLLCPLG